MSTKKKTAASSVPLDDDPKVASDATPHAAPASKTPEKAQEEVRRIKQQSPALLMRTALAKPFPASAIKWKPQSVKGNRCLAIAYIDARLVQVRLDDACGIDGWSDEYTILPDGCVKCRLTLIIPDGEGGERYIAKEDVGSPSDQPKGGDRLKAATSDALKRAAVKFGIGRYLYSLGRNSWVDYDPVKRMVVRPPQLPDWALPKAETPEERIQYHDPEEEGDDYEVASDATSHPSGAPHKAPATGEPKGDKLPDRPKPQGGSPNGSRGEPMKDATLEKLKSEWKDRMNDCDTPIKLSEMCKKQLRQVTKDENHQRALWEMTQQLAGSIGWNWDADAKRFVDENV